MLEYIPLDQTEAEQIFSKVREVKMIELPGGRRVGVGKLEKPGHIVIRIESDLCDNRVALTQFGLRPDAAEALLNLLNQQT